MHLHPEKGLGHPSSLLIFFPNLAKDWQVSPVPRITFVYYVRIFIALRLAIED